MGTRWGRRREREKPRLAQRCLLGLPPRNPPTPLQHLFLFPVCSTTPREKFAASTPFCVETAELNLNADALLQASGCGF